MARFLLALSVAVAACAQPRTDEIVLAFTPDPGVAGSESYLCFGFDADLDGAEIGGIALDALTGPVALHHVALYASTVPFADGPVDCLTMPDHAIPLDVWAVGGGPLALPPDLGLVVPDGTLRFVVQAHALRIDDGPAASRSLKIALRRGASHHAGWLPLRVPTPALPPHQQTESTGACAIADELHVISTWPHMHMAGAEFHGSIARGTVMEPLIDVVPWSYGAQRAYAVSATVDPGDALITRCVWDNTTEATILPGPRIDDEMCEQSIIAWPVEAARCP